MESAQSTSSSKQKGFTLIELMVVIAIIAILATVGVVFFSGAQKNARDARRKTDIDAIANSLENSRTPGSTTYGALAATGFTSGTVPTDPSTNATYLATYCVAYDTGAAAAIPAVPTGWTSASACSSTPAAGGTHTAYTTVAAGVPPATAVSWTVCALLEGGGQYCRSSAQQ